LQQQLKLQSVIRLVVDVQQLQASGLKVDVTLQLQIDDLGQIAVTSQRRLCTPATYYQPNTDPAQTADWRLHSTPATGKSNLYRPQLGYLVVKPGKNQPQTVVFVRMTTSMLAS
jgi:hypothetical protein